MSDLNGTLDEVRSAFDNWLYYQTPGMPDALPEALRAICDAWGAWQVRESDDLPAAWDLKAPIIAALEQVKYEYLSGPIVVTSTMEAMAQRVGRAS